MDETSGEASGTPTLDRRVNGKQVLCEEGLPTSFILPRHTQHLPRAFVLKADLGYSVVPSLSRAGYFWRAWRTFNAQKCARRCGRNRDCCTSISRNLQSHPGWLTQACCCFCPKCDIRELQPSRITRMGLLPALFGSEQSTCRGFFGLVWKMTKAGIESVSSGNALVRGWWKCRAGGMVTCPPLLLLYPFCGPFWRGLRRLKGRREKKKRRMGDVWPLNTGAYICSSPGQMLQQRELTFMSFVFNTKA